MARLYLHFSAAGLFLIALSYGVSPARVFPVFLEISVSGVDQIHMYRSIMGLYIGMSAFWVLGANRARFTRAALLSEVVLMFGLAVGRLISLVIDGLPTPLLVIFGVLEVVMGTWGVLILGRRPDTDSAQNERTR